MVEWAGVQSDSLKKALHEELDRRLGVLEQEGDDAFGRFDARDWSVVIGICLLLPLLMVWWFSP